MTDEDLVGEIGVECLRRSRTVYAGCSYRSGKKNLYCETVASVLRILRVTDWEMPTLSCKCRYEGKSICHVYASKGEMMDE